MSIAARKLTVRFFDYIFTNIITNQRSSRSHKITNTNLRVQIASVQQEKISSPHIILPNLILTYISFDLKR